MRVTKMSLVSLMLTLFAFGCVETTVSDLGESNSELGMAKATPSSLQSTEEVLHDSIEAKIDVQEFEDNLLLAISLYNPYRCIWTGDLYLEHQLPSGELLTIGRAYGVRIPGGRTISGHVLINKPGDLGDHLFAIKAYQIDGQARKPFNNCLLSSTDTDAVCNGPVEQLDMAFSDDVIESEFDELYPESTEANCAYYLRSIWVDLMLEPHRTTIDVMGMWENITRTDWKGDLYVEMVTPYNEIENLRMDSGVSIPAGIGFCSLDEIERPSQPGIYVFYAKALHRAGYADDIWSNPGTTEIFAVCNRQLCEFIEPDQSRATLTLTGDSSIFLASDFFSEFTNITLEYNHRRFDITDLCRIRQYMEGDKINMEVQFNTMNLPIGPRTWAKYTIQLHPMPVVPPGAKTSDSLWIFTNGPE